MSSGWSDLLARIGTFAGTAAYMSPQVRRMSCGDSYCGVVFGSA
jgi:hypothetical protein